MAQAVDVIGDAWALMILRELFLRSRRFDDFERHTGVSPHILSQRLKRFESEGIVTRRVYSDRPVRHEYALTQKGRELWPVIIALKTWGDRWGGWPDGSPITLVHKTCGNETEPLLVCSACDLPIEAAAFEVVMSRQMADERDARA